MARCGRAGAPTGPGIEGADGLGNCGNGVSKVGAGRAYIPVRVKVGHPQRRQQSGTVPETDVLVSSL